mgnify:CR=1 FL=1
MNSKQKREAKKLEKEVSQALGAMQGETPVVADYPEVIAPSETEAREIAKTQGLTQFTFEGIRYRIETVAKVKTQKGEVATMSIDDIVSQNLATVQAIETAHTATTSLRGMNAKEIAVYQTCKLLVQETKNSNFDENAIVDFFCELVPDGAKAILASYAASETSNPYHATLHRISSPPSVGTRSSKFRVINSDGKQVNKLVSSQMILRNGNITRKTTGFYTLRPDLTHSQVERSFVKEAFQQAFAKQLGYKY